MTGCATNNIMMIARIVFFIVHLRTAISYQ
jgi:hypothetical protein